MELTVDEHVSRLIRVLESKYLSDEEQFRPVDIAQKIQFFTLDVISDLAFGHPFGYIEQDRDVYDFIKITRHFFPVAIVMANLPWVVTMMHSRLLRGFLPRDTDKLGFGAFIGSVVPVG